jgi:PAS domain S-box-containing protein
MSSNAEQQEQAELANAVLNTAPVIILVLDSDARVHFVNPYFEALTGWCRDEIVGRSWIDTCLPERHRVEVRKLFSVAISGEPTRGNINPILTRDGREILIEWSDGTTLMPSNGQQRLVAIGTDVTDRIAHEVAVKEQQARLRQILDSMPTFVGQYDLEGRIIDANRYPLDLAKLERDELLGEFFWETPYFSHSQDAADCIRDVLMAAINGETVRHLGSVSLAGGDVRLLEGVYAPLRNADGEIVGAVGSCVDLTERIEMETQLQREQSRLTEAQRIARIGSWELDHRTGELTWTDEVYRVFGVENVGRQATYEDFLNLVWPEDRELVDEAYAQSLVTKQPYEIVHRTANPADAPRWVRERGATHFTDDGTPLVSRGTVQDITTQRRTELELINREAALAAVLAFSVEAIIVSDAEGRITSFSNGAETMFRTPASEMLGQHFTVLIRKQDRVRYLEYLQALAEGYQAGLHLDQSHGLRGQRSDGETFPFDVSVSRSPTSHGFVFSAVVRDASEQRAHEARLEAARRDAEAANAAKSAFLATMSHEVRTPLNSLLGILGVLQNRVDDANTSKMISVANQAGRGLMTVLNDILDYSKIEAGEFHPEVQPFALRGLLDQLVVLFEAEAMAKGLDLSLELPKRVPDRLMGSAIHIERILNVLVDNAIKFTDKGGISVAASWEAEGQIDGQITLTVSDTGIGMTQEEIGRVFNRFVQADGSTTKRFGGTGLGLAIAKALAEQLDGKLSVQSVAGEGSTFVLRVPLSIVEADAKPADHRPQPPTRSPDAANIKILLVEDNHLNQQAIMFMLEPLGCRIELATNGRKGVEKAQKDFYDVILMDIQMPVLDGEAALSAIRQAQDEAGGPRSYIVATTAFIHDGRADHYLKLGFDNVLAKPIEPDAIEAVIAAAMELATVS